jgi:hypothetical protein
MQDKRDLKSKKKEKKELRRRSQKKRRKVEEKKKGGWKSLQLYKSNSIQFIKNCLT